MRAGVPALTGFLLAAALVSGAASGAPLDGFVLRHKDIAAGGDLAFRMGP